MTYQIDILVDIKTIYGETFTVIFWQLISVIATAMVELQSPNVRHQKT